MEKEHEELKKRSTVSDFINKINLQEKTKKQQKTMKIMKNWITITKLF